MSNKRSKNRSIAKETLAILDRGSYTNPSGNEVSIAKAQKAAVKGSKLYRPEEFDALFEKRNQLLADKPAANLSIEVVNETTTMGAKRLVEAGAPKVLALNFASARNVGGGFLNGSSAQEESLCRASGLFNCIGPHQDYYMINRAHKSCIYTDHMIYSPDVPVFRDDNLELLEAPYLVSFVTAPAPNAGAIMHNEPQNLDKVPAAFAVRIEQVLSIAVVNGYEHLVLGAWGCGAFRNKAEEIAPIFKEVLLDSGKFAGAFEKVVFSVLDRGGKMGCFLPFEQVLKN